VSWISALDRKLLRDFAEMRGQAFAIAVIVACGVGMLIMSLGALSSLKESQETYYDRYRFADVFASAKRAPQSLLAEIRNIDGVRTAETRIARLVTLDIEGFDDPANAQLVSLPDHGEPQLNRVLLYEGRWPDPRRPDEAVASKAFMEAHGFRPGDTVGAIVNGRKREIEFVGIGDSPEYVHTLGPGALLPDDKRFAVFWMRRKALEAAFDLDGAFDDVSLLLAPEASAETVIDDLDALLDPYGGVGAYGREDQLSNAFIESEMDQLRTMARILPPLFLGVSAMLLHAILTRLIATERQQIGLLKAFGYADGEIAWHYLKLALAITGIGVLGGFALGAALARMLTELYAVTFRFPVLIYELDPSAFAVAAAAALLSATVGAVSAALDAARLAPAEAMVAAPPARYRRGVFERASARIRLDQPTRMILRHLARWPARAGSTVLGVAAAQALLIGTLFSFDSVTALLDRHFYRSDAYDASINFAEPRPVSAVAEIARLPGVLSVEPNRDVVARLRLGPLHERAMIVGVEPGGRLKRLIDPKGRFVPPTEEGVGLSSQLAGMLKASIGDRVTLEVLEGRRPVVDATVTQIVEDYIAAPAYMSRRLANRLLYEGDVVTGVYARLDASQAAAFSAAANDVPGVATVTLRSAALDAFDETLADTINIMMTIYAVIGAAIAAGVVYNAARIALTERSHELASLRVLGFTRTETSYILLGELALLILLALPLGAGLGFLLAWTVATGMSSELYRIPLAVAPATVGFAACIVTGGGLAAALLVRGRIDELDLISALKTRE